MKEDIKKLKEERELCLYWVRECKKDLEDGFMTYTEYKGCKKVLNDNEKRLNEINDELNYLEGIVLNIKE